MDTSVLSMLYLTHQITKEKEHMSKYKVNVQYQTWKNVEDAEAVDITEL